jgi:Cu(I)/Ag(I) efflux system membrane protein CusA/SilA
MVLHGAQRRIRPALIPILTSTGRGSDIMVPMAIPSFGGMVIAMLTVFVVPVLYCWVEEGRVKAR